MPNYDAPADQPVVELTAEEEDIGIPNMEARRLRLMALVNSAPDENDPAIEAAFEEETRLEHAILATPAATVQDLLIKAEIWRQAGASEGDTCDHDHLAEHWSVFVDDIRQLACAAS